MIKLGQLKPGQEVRIENTHRKIAGEGKILKLLMPENPMEPIGAIVVDFQNNSGAPITNARVLFRGSKRYGDQSRGDFDLGKYPARCSMLPFVYPVVVEDIPQNTTSTQGQFNNIPINIDTDADFALRYGFANSFKVIQEGDPPYTGTFSNLFAQLSDVGHRAYSNEPIHINDLFGSAAYANFRSGLFTPEIYIPRNGVHFLNLVRSDIAGGDVTLHVAFGGAKVFKR